MRKGNGQHAGWSVKNVGTARRLYERTGKKWKAFTPEKMLRIFTEHFKNIQEQGQEHVLGCMSTCAASLKPSRHRWVYLLMMTLIGASLLGGSFHRRSSALLSEVEGAKILDEQIAAFNRINQHGGYGVRLFNAAGKEFDFKNPGAEPVDEVEIFFNDGNRGRTKLVKPGVWGSLLEE